MESEDGTYREIPIVTVRPQICRPASRPAKYSLLARRKILFSKSSPSLNEPFLSEHVWASCFSLCGGSDDDSPALRASLLFLWFGGSRTNKLLPMQVEVEPWMQPRCTVSLPVLEVSMRSMLLSYPLKTLTWYKITASQCKRDPGRVSGIAPFRLGSETLSVVS